MVSPAHDSTDAVLRRNLSVHEATWGEAPTWTAADLACGRVAEAPDAGERPASSLMVGGGSTWHRVHSGRDPEREAERSLDQAVGDGPAPEAVIVVGAGLGYVLDAAFRRFPNVRVLVIEPMPGLVPPLMGRKDWTGPISSRHLRVVAAPRFEGRDQAWSLLSGSTSPPVIVHPVLARVFHDASMEAVRVAATIVAQAGMNDEARRRLGDRYRRNTLANLHVLFDAFDAVDLQGAAPGRPAVVAAAGPSLDRNIEQLQRYRDRVTLVAVDTALRPLVVAGLEPDFVVAVDPSETNARTLTQAGAHTQARLVGELSLDPAVFPHFEGRTWLFRVGDNPPWPALRANGIDLGCLHAWGSVLITAVDLAVRLGAQPVILLGADLGFTDGRPYCRDTVYEFEWARAVLAGVPLRAIWQPWLDCASLVETGINGAETRTTPTMVAFRDALLSVARKLPAGHLVNATGAGLLRGDGLALGSLHDLLEQTPPAALQVPRRPVRADATIIGSLLEQHLVDATSIPPGSELEVAPALSRAFALTQSRAAFASLDVRGAGLSFVAAGNQRNDFRQDAVGRLLEAVESVSSASCAHPSLVGTALEGVMRYARCAGSTCAPAAVAADRVLAGSAVAWARRLTFPRPLGPHDVIRVGFLGIASAFNPRDVMSWALHSCAKGLGRLRHDRVEAVYYDLAGANEAYLAELARCGVTVRRPLGSQWAEASCAQLRARLLADGIDVTVSLGATWLTAVMCATDTAELQVGFDYGLQRFQCGWTDQIRVLDAPVASDSPELAGVPLDPSPLREWCHCGEVRGPGGEHCRFGYVGPLSDWAPPSLAFVTKVIGANQGSSLRASGLGDPAALRRAFDQAGLGHRLEIDPQNDIDSTLRWMDVALVPRQPSSLFTLLLSHLDIPLLREADDETSIPEWSQRRAADHRLGVSPCPATDPDRFASRFAEWVVARLAR